MEFTAGIINIILIYIIARSLLKLLNPNKEVTNKDESIASKEEKAGSKAIEIEMVKDEVCNKSIPREEALILVREEKKHYFCSWECREKFLNNSL